MQSPIGSNHKGAVAEAEIAAAATRLGIPVLKPLSEHGRYDLVFDLRRELARVQCKWGRLDRGGDIINVHVGGSRHTPRGYVLSSYAAGEIDFLAVYCGELDRCYLLRRRWWLANEGSTFASSRRGMPSARVLPLRQTSSSLGL